MYRHRYVVEYVKRFKMKANDNKIDFVVNGNLDSDL